MSSDVTKPLPLFQIMEVRKIAARSTVQLGHLASHVDQDDPVVGYWLDLLRRELRWIEDELEVIIYDEKEQYDG